MHAVLGGPRVAAAILVAGTLASLCALSGCVATPGAGAPGQILSRLPADMPPPQPPQPLSQQERDRYTQIDKQVLHDQAARARYAAWAAAVPVVPLYYGGYGYAAYPVYQPYPYPYAYPYRYGYGYAPAYGNFSIGVGGAW
jgi:hypothetical protein